MNTELDVIVLGYGPVGHVMAALLGHTGWRVGVIDRQLGLYPLPRIGHLDHEVMRILQALDSASVAAKRGERRRGRTPRTGASRAPSATSSWTPAARRSASS